MSESYSSVSWKTDINGNTIFIDNHVKDIYGYSPDEIYIRGKEVWLNRIHHEDVDEVERSFQELFNLNKPFNVIYRIKHKDNNWIWLHDRASQVIEENGRKYAFGLFCKISDKENQGIKPIVEEHVLLTKIKNLQEQLAIEKGKNQKTKEYEKLYKNSLNGFCKMEVANSLSIDLPIEQQIETMLNEFIVTDCNKTFANWFDFSEPSDLIGLPLKAYLGNDLQGKSIVRKFLEDEYSWTQFDLKIKSKSGKERFYLDNIKGFIKGRKLYKIWIEGTDVTEKVMRQKLLQESEAKFHTAFMSGSSPKTITTVKGGVIIEANNAFFNLFGYCPDEVIGRTTTELNLFKDVLGMRRKLLNDFQTNGSIRDREIKMYGKDGFEFDLIIDAESIIINGESYILSTAKNITEIKKTNKELEFYKTKLEDIVEQRTQELKNVQQQLIQSEKMASVGLLAAGIAHEINNPINYISGGMIGLKKSCAILKEQLLYYKQKSDVYENENTPLDEKTDLAFRTLNKMFNGIEQGLYKTTQIVNSMRVFSSNNEYRFEKVAINELLHTVLALLYNSFTNRIKVIEKYGKNLVIDAMPGQLQQVFMNIITNAIEAITVEGVIVVEARQNKQRNRLIISIKDNGIGISKLAQKKIFDPFFTTKDVGEGAGLGLYLSYSYIEQHSGTISVKSEKNIGTECIIELPYEQENYG